MKNREDIDELASDYVLDLMEANERKSFELRMKAQPECENRVREFDDTVAYLARRIPVAEPDESLFENILREINEEKANPKKTLSNWHPIFSSGWGVAATLFAAFALYHFFVVAPILEDRHPLANSLEKNSHRLQINPANDNIAQKQQLVQNTDPASAESTPENTTDSTLKNIVSLVNKTNSPTDGARLRELKKMIDALETRNLQYTVTRPGKTRLTIIELNEPANNQKDKIAHLAESTQVAGLVANSLEFQLSSEWLDHLVASTESIANNPSDSNAGISSAPPMPESMGTSQSPLASNSQQVTIDATEAISRDLGSLHDLPLFDSFFDWEGSLDTLSPETGQIGTNNNTHTQLNRPTGFTILVDGSSSGILSVQNLPDPKEGNAYQLWLIDPVLEQPLDIGILPSVDSGTGRIYFEMKNGVVPDRFIITEEPNTGSTKPTGNVIIESP